jgi:hypothetical protein
MTDHPLATAKRGRRAPTAYILVCVIVCLTVVAVIATAWMRTIVLEHRQVRAAALGVQAEYLVASGLERAVAQLAGDPSYAGEIWRVDADSLRSRDGATVTIRVTNESDDPRARRVRVAAEYPDEGAMRARRTSETTIQLPTGGEAT